MLESEEFKKLLPLVRNDKVLRGTYNYLAPELMSSGPKSPQCDIYSLGVVLYELLTLKPAFNDQESTQITKIAKGDFVVPALKAPDREIPKSLEAICLKAMSNDPKERYANASEILKEMDRFKKGFATDAEHASAWQLFALLYKRNKALSNVLVIALIIIVGLTAFTIYKISQSEKLAITERNNAVEARNETLEALNQVKLEQQQKLTMALEAAKKYQGNVRLHLFYKNYEKADTAAETMFHFASHDPQIRLYFARYLTAAHKFDKALEVLADLAEVDDLRQVITAIKNKCELENIVKTADALEGGHNEKMLVSYFLSNALDKVESLDQKIAVLKKEVEANSRPGVQIDYELKDIGLHLAISKCSSFYPGDLSKFDVKSLDISEMPMNRPEYIPWANLIYLNAANTRLKGLENARSLKSLNIRNCPIINFKGLNKMKSLESIDIRGVKNFPLKTLLELKKLKEVIIDPTQEKEWFMNQAHFIVKVH